jgi:hypothetical protein
MATKFYSNHTELSQDQKQQIVDCLINHRLSNYGYNWKVFRSMSAQRSRLRATLRLADIDKLNWSNLSLNRFQFEDGEVWYIVGQSANEEITHRMQQLVSKTKS